MPISREEAKRITTIGRGISYGKGSRTSGNTPATSSRTSQQRDSDRGTGRSASTTSIRQIEENTKAARDKTRAENKRRIDERIARERGQTSGLQGQHDAEAAKAQAIAMGGKPYSEMSSREKVIFNAKLKKQQENSKTTTEQVGGGTVETNVLPGTSTEQPQSTGWDRILDVTADIGSKIVEEATFGAIKGRDVELNIQNETVKWGLEAAANNPLTTALVLSGTAGIVKSAITKAGALVAKTAVKTGASHTTRALAAKGITSGVIQSGSAASTAKLSAKAAGNLLSKAGFTKGAAGTILKVAVGTGAAVSSYSFAQFLNVSEAVNQTLGGAKWQAMKTGNDQMVAEIQQLEQEILNPEGWNKFLSYVPGINVVQASKNIIEANAAANKVWNKIIEDEKIKRETGMTDEEVWDRRKQEERDQDQAVADHRQAEFQRGTEKRLEAELAKEQLSSKNWAKAQEVERKRDQEAAAEAQAAYEASRQRQREAELAFEREKASIKSSAYTTNTGGTSTQTTNTTSPTNTGGGNTNTTTPDYTSQYEAYAKAQAEQRAANAEAQKAKIARDAAAQVAASIRYNEQAEKIRQEQIRQRNEDARYWANYAAQQRVLEAQDRLAIQQYWAAYDKRKAQLYDEGRPSNLNFGLL